MAREFVEGPNADEVLLAQVDITIAALEFASELAASAGDAGIVVEGIPGGVTPENLLREFGRQLIASDLDGNDGSAPAD